MFPVIAVPPQRQSHVTNAVRKATSYVVSFWLSFKVPDITPAFSSPETALKQVTLAEVVGATAAAAELALELSVTSVARSAILPVRALRLPPEEVEEEAEATARSVADPKKLGRFFFPV